MLSSCDPFFDHFSSPCIQTSRSAGSLRHWVHPLAARPCMFCLQMDMLRFPKSQKGTTPLYYILAPKLMSKSQHDVLSWIDAASAQPREATSRWPSSPSSGRSCLLRRPQPHTRFSPHLLPSPPLTSTARAPCHAWSFISNPFRLQVRCAELGTNQTSQLAS